MRIWNLVPSKVFIVRRKLLGYFQILLFCCSFYHSYLFFFVVTIFSYLNKHIVMVKLINVVSTVVFSLFVLRETAFIVLLFLSQGDPLFKSSSACFTSSEIQRWPNKTGGRISRGWVGSGRDPCPSNHLCRRYFTLLIFFRILTSVVLKIHSLGKSSQSYSYPVVLH